MPSSANTTLVSRTAHAAFCLTSKNCCQEQVLAALALRFFVSFCSETGGVFFGAHGCPMDLEAFPEAFSQPIMNHATICSRLQ